MNISLMSSKPAFLVGALGFVGGVLGYVTTHAVVRQGWAYRPVPAVLRAHSFELLDSGGGVVGRWGIDAKNGVALTLFDPKGNRTVELSESNGNQSLVFYQDKTWVRMSLVAGSTGMSALHLGDFNKEARLSLGAIAEGDLPSLEPPSLWGLALHGPGHQTYLTTAVNGKFRSGRESASISVLRPDGTYWHVP